MECMVRDKAVQELAVLGQWVVVVLGVTVRLRELLGRDFDCGRILFGVRLEFIFLGDGKLRLLFLFFFFRFY
jgi:hypothetical protein